ncbi:uncharacterized protein LOC112588440 isoform X2 [Harpegnathos saltator]|uniref:uncharacterized protein LOC105180512 isoform X2 n=1 Tax=Harpegnathos saltator TaxID=610380 RepID=UPI000590174A|nr:uncharacterized protein LOC105180512 isoform X2 [Harpegnathos saltator]XP_025154194.1 uncharacterized protein LOC112588440 isoform X2 [Harpegnathos saltator]
MEHLHFLSDTVEPRKTITNFESLEHPLSRSDTSPTSLETFQSEEYMYNIQEEFQAKRQLSETGIDAVDEAILNLVGKQNSADTMNSDDLFYLSISRDSQQLKRKITLKDTCTTSTFSSYNRGTK